MRQQQLSTHPLCMRCNKFERTAAAVDVDHVHPHRGDEKVFYDSNNLQSLCRSCHSYKTNQEMKGIIEDYR